MSDTAYGHTSDAAHSAAPNKDKQPSLKTSYIVVGVVAAAVSAATVAYVFWARSRRMVSPTETVQQLLDRCHDQVRSIEQRLTEATEAVTAV